MYDIIIVGGGPAGLTAALYARRAGKSVIIIEKNGFGGQITYSPNVENIPGTAQISGNEFADKLLDQVLKMGADVELENVVSIELEDNIKHVITEDGKNYEAKTLVLATGVKHRMLGIDGESELVGHGISFCAVCDGAFYAGQHVAVIGGGNSALQEAILLSKTCREVTVIQNLATFTGEKALVNTLLAQKNVHTLFSSIVTAYDSNDGELTGLQLKNVQTDEKSFLSVDGAFLAVGLIPENENFSNLAKIDNFGYFASGEDCRTITNGIFVAGDCRGKNVRQVTTACADGAVAALAACDYIDGGCK